MTDKRMQDVLKEIIKDVFTPIMKSLGFVKNGNTFVKTEEGFQKTLNIQSSQWNNSESVSFTIECGIFFPEMFLKIFSDKELPKYPQPVHCLYQFRRRIDQLRNKGPQWYELDTNTDVEKLRKEVKWDLEWCVRRHFEQYNEMHNFMVR